MSRLNGRIAALSRKLPHPEPPRRCVLDWPTAEGPGTPPPTSTDGALVLRWPDERDDPQEAPR